jgi:hypothetical protein
MSEMTQKKHTKRIRLRPGQLFFRGWKQIALVLGMNPETLRKSWYRRGLPIWREMGKPVTSKAALEEYSRQRVAEVRRHRGWD